MRTVRLASFAAPLVLVALAMRAPALDQVPLYAQYSSEGQALHSYTVPIHLTVAIHKLITFHVGLNGMMYYRSPGKLVTTIEHVPEKYQKAFAELGTPRTWPLNYDMQVVGKDVVNGQCVYHLRGTPLQTNDIDYMLADVAGSSAPIKAIWYLRGGGTISSTILMGNVGDYTMPKEQHADIDAQGAKLHVDVSYGDYDLNSQVSDAVF